MNCNLICIFICTPICTNFFYSCKKWVLQDSHENEAQDKRNLGAKDAAKGYLAHEEPNEI
jgi:hypothetical protein